MKNRNEEGSQKQDGDPNKTSMEEDMEQENGTRKRSLTRADKNPNRQNSETTTEMKGNDVECQKEARTQRLQIDRI